MDNENRSGQPGNDNWLDEILPPTDLGEEIGPDEQAIQGANLIHPSDAEVDKIVQETLSGAWDESEPQEPQDSASEPELFRDDEYRDAFGEGDELAQVFSGKPLKKKTTPAEPETPVRKGRPKRKKGYGLLGIPHLLATAVWAVLIIAIGVSLGRMIWVSAADVLAFGREEEIVTITITDSDVTDMEAIAKKLHDAGLIRYPGLFKLYAGLTVDEGEISAGTFDLNTLYDYHALVNHMNAYSTAREEVELMFSEGSTCADIFAKLEENGVCTVAELEEYAANGELDDYWFLEGVERGDKYCLEGFLFPDTYRFYTNDEPERVLEKFLDTFDYRFSSNDLQEAIPVLNERLAQVLAGRGYDQDYIDAQMMSIRDIVTVASMIQKETATVPEGYKISSVIYNRLTNQANYPYLNIDATLIYALNGNIDPETGKTKPLTKADLEMDHPYNSYNQPGLIPGPICNPGLNSLDAALEPDDTDYYFYALDPDLGEHRFFTNSEDFDEFVNSVSYGD